MTKMLLAHGGHIDLGDAHLPATGHDRMAAKVRVLDIAHALAKLNRFNGHTARLYSVAEHSLHVVTVMERELGVRDPAALLCGLMHDAHEAYLGDVSRPMQEALGEAAGRVWGYLSDSVQRIVLRRLCIEGDWARWAEVVKQADNIVCATEMRDLFTDDCGWAMPAKPSEVVFLDPHDEEDWRGWADTFCELYAELQAGIHVMTGGLHQGSLIHDDLAVDAALVDGDALHSHQPALHSHQVAVEHEGAID